jgi:hypothetical protein
MISGGSVNVNLCDLGPSCRGYATRAADLQLNWSGEPLRILFEADQTGKDTVLIVNDYTGNWICNDDFSGLNPLLDLPARSGGGEIDIWVASYSQSDNVNGVLYITEMGYTHSDLPLPSPTTQLDYTLPANYGSITLPGYFLPDPKAVSVVSGGSINVSNLGLGPNCRGYATSSPDLQLEYTGTVDLRILFKADQAGKDTVLIINDYTGNWRCNDDFGGLNPAIDLPPGSGIIDIWVASYNQSESVSGAIYITEWDLTHDDLP